MLLTVPRRRSARAVLPSRRLTAVLAAGATLLATAVTGLGLATPAQAANRVTPGNFTGYGFDQCEAPSQAAMDAWLHSSPYWSVGIYIAGGNRACKEQRNLTSDWVSTQLRNGWRLLPINVGPQASCYHNPNKKLRIQADPTNNYATARKQGRNAAVATIRAAQALGIVKGSTLWYDLEHAEGLVTDTGCRESALRFLSTWTATLHNNGYVSGVYAHLHSGIKMIDDADLTRPGRFSLPDYLWIARWDGNASVEVDPAYLRPTAWMPHRRVHQYLGDHDETHGGVRITIDSNYMSLGRGTLARKAPSFCGGVRVDFPRYGRLLPGQRHDRVKAAQCLLKRKRFYGGRLTGVYNPRTERAVAAFQTARGLRPTGKLGRTAWTVMLSDGFTPVTKIGSGGQQVRRIQRSLNAAIHAELPVTGIFDQATTRAVRTYQRGRRLPRTGVVSTDTWAALRRGLL